MEGRRKLRAPYQPAILFKEPVMHTRFILIAAASLLSTAAIAAEPTKTAEPTPAQPQPQPQPAHVVLASADDVHAPAPAGQQQASAPAKRRVGRVTTCRCGDQQPQPEE